MLSQPYVARTSFLEDGGPGLSSERRYLEEGRRRKGEHPLVRQSGPEREVVKSGMNVAGGGKHIVMGRQSWGTQAKAKSPAWSTETPCVLTGP